MKNSIKRAQSQACLNFAERKNFRLQAKHKILMTLALLLTAVTGAWATGPTVYESGQTVNQNDLKVGDIILGGVTINGTNDGGYITLIAGRFSLDGNIPDINSEVNHYPITVNADGSWKHPNTTWVFAPIDASGQAGNAWEVTAKTPDENNYDVSIVGIQYVADAIDVTPVTGKTNEWTFTMPAFDVELTPIYAPEFTAAFKAGNDLTIQSGKATVSVTESDGTTAYTGATLDENGNYKPLYEEQKITMTAAPGYKFRKVEVKKGAAPAPTTTVTWSPVSCYGTYTQDGVTLTPSNGDAVNGNNFYQFGDNTFTTTLGKFIKIEIVFESTTYTFDGWTKETAEQYQPDPDTYPDWWENLLKLTWTGNAESVTIKGKDVFGIRRITFTIQ